MESLPLGIFLSSDEIFSLVFAIQMTLLAGEIVKQLKNSKEN